MHRVLHTLVAAAAVLALATSTAQAEYPDYTEPDPETAVTVAAVENFGEGIIVHGTLDCLSGDNIGTYRLDLTARHDSWGWGPGTAADDTAIGVCEATEQIAYRAIMWGVSEDCDAWDITVHATVAVHHDLWHEAWRYASASAQGQQMFAC